MPLLLSHRNIQGSHPIMYCVREPVGLSWCAVVCKRFGEVLVENLVVCIILFIISIPLVKSLRGSGYSYLRCCLYRKENPLLQ